MKRLAVFALAFAGIIGVVPATGSALPPGVVPGPNSITGTITDVNGVPLEGITVHDGAFTAFVSTGPDGSYLLDGLQADTEYTVFANDPQGAHLDAQSAPVLVSAFDPVVVDLTLPDIPVPVSGNVHGVVTDGLGTPLGGVRIFVDFGAETVSAADGTYSIDHPSVDFPQQVNASDPSGVHGPYVNDSVLPSEAGTTLDIVMPDAVLDVTGTITDPDGAPVAGAFVRDGGFFGVTSVTGLDGRYGLSGIGAGTHTLQIAPPSGQAALVGTTRTVEVIDGQTATVDAQLRRSATFEVTVTAGGVPANAEVAVFSTEFGFAGAQFPDADGLASVPVPTDGEYYVRIDSQDFHFASEFFPDAAFSSAAQHFTITGEQHVAVAVDLEAAGSISGTITMPDGTLGDFTQVTAFPSGPGIVDGELPPCNLPQDTDPPGTFRVGCLRPGAYVVEGFGNRQADNEYYRDSQSPFNATPVQVSAGHELSGIDLTLPPKSPDLSITGFSQNYFVSGTTTRGVHLYGSGFPADFHALIADTSTLGVGPGTFMTVTKVVSSREAIIDVRTEPGAIGATPLPRAVFLHTTVGGFVECFECFYAGDATTKVGSVAGRVTDTRGRAVSGAAVRFTGSDGSTVRAAVTGADGRYTATGLPPMKYTVFFDGTETLNPQYLKNKAQPSPASVVSVASGKTQKNVDAELSRRGPITVTAAAPKAVPAADVSFDLLGTGLQSISGGFRVIVDAPFGHLTWQTTPVSETRLHVTGFVSGGTYDLRVEWTGDDGSTKSTTCVQCLTVYDQLSLFPATGEPIVRGATTTLGFLGQGIIDITAVTVDGTGVTVDGWTINDQGELDVTFTASSDATADPFTGAISMTVRRVDGATADTFIGLSDPPPA